MKKIVSVLLAVLVLASILTGCGKGPTGNNEKLSIVTTIFPEYDWVMNVLGDKAPDELIYSTLLKSGGEAAAKQNFSNRAYPEIK